MGILNRLGRVVKSNVNALLDAAEDPEKTIAQTVSDMRSGLKQARRELVSTLGTAKRLTSEADELRREALGWEDKAALALRSGDDALARQALGQKLQLEKRAAQSSARAAQALRAADDMKAALDRLEQKTEELDAHKSALAAQVRAARSAPETGGPLPHASAAFADLERMASRVDSMEAEIEAAAVLDDPHKRELEARFRELEQNADSRTVEDQLAELKRKAAGG
jgi:phage shock protein A